MIWKDHIPWKPRVLNIIYFWWICALRPLTIQVFVHPILTRTNNAPIGHPYIIIYIEIYVYNIIITIICVSEVHYRTGPMVPWFTERAKGRAVDTVRGRASAVVCGGSREAWQTNWPGSAKVPVAQQRTNWLTRVPMAVKSPAFLAFCGRVFSKMRSRSKKCAQFVPYFSIQIP